MKKSIVAFTVTLTTHFFTMTAYAREGGAASAYNRSPHAANMARHKQIIEISVTSDGFIPALSKVRAGHPVKLIVTRMVDRTCATDIVIKEFKIFEKLPLNKPVEVTFTPTKPGKIRFACAMDMIAGEIVVE